MAYFWMTTDKGAIGSKPTLGDLKGTDPYCFWAQIGPKSSTKKKNSHLLDFFSYRTF